MSAVPAHAPGGHAAPDVCRRTQASGGVKLSQPPPVDHLGSPNVAEGPAAFTERRAPEPCADLLHFPPGRNGKDR
ncbi:hypothetical protein BN1232_05983 [Mycobacterium lentiflavum]|uniref:Uncharacterized protein n=1 Tax=Mycobacterium lentiflavum TaxID=141349 RepID=A0A0E3WE75_MYCLN|nr:hypothetical protein BN1232_05983 [Mycobacterium lentiflavum]